MIANKQKMEDSCPRDQSRGRRTKKMHLHQPQPLLHMDECDDPDCIDFEQLQELQKSIDSFTDYTQYERCCDGDHAEGDDCNGITTDCCQGSIALEDGCEECVDDCDECLEEHEFAYANDFDDLLDIGSPVKCDDDCEKCEEECEENGHERRDCPQDHHTSWDSCITTCGICVDPTPLPLLAPEAEMQLYDLNSYMPHIRPCDERCTPPPFFEEVPDLNLPDSTPSFDMALDHWQTFQQAHHCAPDPCLIDHQMNQFQPPQHLDPQFGFSFGCDPTVPGNQYPWQDHDSLPQICNVQAFSSLDLNGIADEHVASHTGSNRAHCPICHQWLNAEGSNFRRHMASHRPENEHMKCKHQHLGCRRKFPRLDNLRRHEKCCKYGKRAAAAGADGHAHHHHHHHHHHAVSGR